MKLSEKAAGKRPEGVPSNKPTSQKSRQIKRTRFPCVFTLRTVLYGLGFALAFSLTVALLGLVSFQLHRYGNSYANYASMEYKHALGLLLFSTILSLLITLSHPWLGVGFMAFASFVAAIFFGTGAGVINRTAPYKGTFCATKPANEYPPAWQPYANECARVVAIQGLAWALWGLYIFILVGTLCHKLRISTRPTPEGFYFAKP